MLTANRIQRLLESMHPAAWEPFPVWPDFGFEAGYRPRIWSTDQDVTIQMDAPGRKIEDFEVAIERNRIQVSMQGSLYDSEDDLKFRARERSDGQQKIDFTLPFAADPEQTSVEYKHGVLQIIARKPEQELPRKLEVRQG